jgi:PAS domain S-box-containing protein
MEVVTFNTPEKQMLSQSRMLESIGPGVLAADILGNISYINSPGQRLTGWRSDEVLGKNITGLVPPEFRNKTQDIIKSLSEGNTWLGEMPIRFQDGNIVQGWININPVFDDDGRIVGSVGVIIGIKNPEKTVELAPESLEVSNGRALNHSQEDILEILKQIKSWDLADSDLTMDHQLHPEAIDLLKDVQTRFQAARKQLNQLTEALSREEYLVRQMHSVLQSFQNAAIPDPKIEVIPNKYRLEVNCLGIFKVSSLTKQIHQWQSNRAKSVFEYLISKHTAPVSRDILMEALWPEYSSRAAANNLKTAIHDLRQNLSPLFNKTEYPGILFSHDGYLINPEIDLLIDAEEFELFWNQGKHLEKEGKQAEAVRKFEKAEALYQGDYLEDSLYEEWTISRRETLKDIYLLIINKLADFSMNTADYENCITYCHKILEKDNCREDTYRILMSSYSRLHQKNNALRWYENCRQTLNSELGSPPSQVTIDLFNRVKRDETV